MDEQAPSAKPAAKPAGQYHHGDLRPALLATAYSLVEAEGLEGLTLRAVARRLGVSHAAPLHHFPTRASLVWALAEEGFRLFADALEAAEVGPEEGRLVRVGRAYLAFAAAHPHHYNLMFGTDLPAQKDPSPEFQLHSGRALAVLSRSTHDVPNGSFLGQRALFAWSLVHGLVSLKRGPLLCNLPAEAQADLEVETARVLDFFATWT